MPQPEPGNRVVSSAALHALPARRMALPPLPRPLTTLVGRQAEVAQLAALLHRDDVRLVTLTGPGGVGKTRLAIRVAVVLADDYPDGIAFINLASIVDVRQVLPEIARVLGVRAEDPAAALSSLESALHNRRLLLILDNMEQVRAAATDIVALLAACPWLQILVTSRVRLRVSGEHVVGISPLALPDAGPNQPLDRVGEVDAVRLFLERGRAANTHFALTSENAFAVAEICRRLDGLPLAIELAAARAGVLTPRVMLARLEQRLTVLHSGPLDAPARQQALQDTIAWSYDLLPPPAQRLFARLAVFNGGFSLRGAEAVAAEATVSGVAPSSGDILDQLALLVDHSLLVPVAQDAVYDEPRFAMLATIREGALDYLEAHGEADAARRRHAAYVLRIAQEAEPELSGIRQREWLLRLERDASNIRAALDWAIRAGEAELSLSLASDLLLFWLKRGHIAEGRTWLERALALPQSVSSPARVHALLSMAGLAGPLGDAPRAAEALSLSRQFDDVVSTARSAMYLGNAVLLTNPAQAIDHFENALPAFVEHQVRPWQIQTLMVIGMATQQLGDSSRAVATLEQAVALSLEHGETWCHILSLSNLASVVRASGEDARAISYYSESLRLALDFGDGITTNEALLGLGGVLATSHRALEGAQLFGAAEVVRETIGISLRHLMIPEIYQRDLTTMQQALDEAAFAAAWAAGRATDPRELLAALEATREEHTIASAPATKPSPVGLTARELDVLRLLAEGRTDPEIATILYIGTRTVEFHVANILGKLGAENRRAAAGMASRLALI